MISTIEVLRQSNLRATSPRLAILSLLLKQQQPIRVESIWEQVQEVDRVTVYRTLETLERAGVVRQIDLGHGHSHYELNDPRRHHHHLVCESCGRVEDVRISKEDTLLRRLERTHKFKARAHSFEVFGQCANCQ